MPKVHKCSYCSREFKRPEHLRRHCRAHTGEKPYVCHCGACFTRNDLLRRHERLAHADDPKEVSHSADSSSQVTGLVDFPVLESDGQANINEGRNRSIPWQPPQTYTSEEDNVDFNFPHLDFEALSRSLGLNIDWFEPSLPKSAEMGLQEGVLPGQANFQDSRASASEKKSAGPMPFTSRLVGHATGMGFSQVQFVRQNPNTSPLIMTEDRLRILKRNLQQFEGCLPNTSLPSCHTFTKSLSAWEETLANHLPYIHIPTLCLNDCIPELVLALAALGAQQRYETRTALLLYHAGKTIALERINLNRSRNKAGTSTSRLGQSGTVIQCASTLLTLIVFATWSANATLVDEAFELHNPLMSCLREDGLIDDNEMSSQDWHSWALSETRIRIKVMAFCFLNLHTIAYNHPPVLFWFEVDLKLPCTVREWHATDAFQWLLARQEVLDEQKRFPGALKVLLSSDGQTSQIQPRPSPFGNYVLLHGLLQRIYLIRQLAVTPTLQEEDIVKLQKALSHWATTWQRTSESSLNPRDESGPISFTSVALLSLAHVRIHLDIGPYRDLALRNPAQVAAALAKVPSLQLQRTDSAASALLYAVHALSIPVAIGIEYVVRSQAIFWCCQHSLGSLECAVFLSKWLYTIAATTSAQTTNPNLTNCSFSGSEKYVLNCLRQVLTEAAASADWGDTDTTMWLEDAFHMGLAVLRIWSRVFSNSSAWPITVTIGKSLTIYADAYENRRLEM